MSRLLKWKKNPKKVPKLVDGQVGDVVKFLDDDPEIRDYMQGLVDRKLEKSFSKWSGEAWHQAPESVRLAWKGC